MDITNMIANLSMDLSATKVQSQIQTSLLKKAMDVNEVMATELLDSMQVTNELVPNFEGTINRLV